MNDRQVVKTGDNSGVIQAGGAVFVNMDKDQVVSALLGFLEGHSSEALDIVRETMLQSRKELTERFVESIPKEQRVNLANPGMLQALSRAQYNYATDGDEATADVYLGILKERIKHTEKDAVTIAAKRALEAVPTLSERHMKILAGLYFLYGYFTFGSHEVEHLRQTYRLHLSPLQNDLVSASLFDLQHLISSGTVSYEPTISQNLRNLINRASPNSSPSVFDVFSDDDVLGPILQRATEMAETAGRFNCCFVNATGRVIAHSYFNERLSIPIPLIMMPVA